jgi:hypothetical protein
MKQYCRWHRWWSVSYKLTCAAISQWSNYRIWLCFMTFGLIACIAASLELVGCGLEDRGFMVRFSAEAAIFMNRPDRLCFPPSLLLYGYKELFSRGYERQVSWRWPHTSLKLITNGSVAPFSHMSWRGQLCVYRMAAVAVVSICLSRMWHSRMINTAGSASTSARIGYNAIDRYLNVVF